jgi:hypothetical protein
VICRTHLRAAVHAIQVHLQQSLALVWLGQAGAPSRGEGGRLRRREGELFPSELKVLLGANRIDSPAIDKP